MYLSKKQAWFDAVNFSSMSLNFVDQTTLISFNPKDLSQISKHIVS